MEIMNFLTGVGSKLGLVRIVEVTDAAKPQKLTTRAISLKDLGAEVRSERVRALAELPAELSIEFEKVFETAGVKAPAHGWTIARLQQLLETEQYKTMTREAAQKGVLGILAADKAPPEDILQDALLRDKAIDAFEQFVFKKMKARVEARQARSGQIEDEIRALREEQAKLGEETKADEARWQQWHQRKTAIEEGWEKTLNYLLEKPGVTVDRDAHPLR